MVYVPTTYQISPSSCHYYASSLYICGNINHKRKDMRKLYTTLLLACSLMAGAQNAISIHQKDGKVANFAFSEKPIVTYADNQLGISFGIVWLSIIINQ